VIFFGYPNDRFDHIWETAATAAAFVQRVVDLRGHDQRPWILVKKIDDRVFDLLLRDQVAMADNHLFVRAGERPACRTLARSMYSRVVL
jgi:hypothetical protein